MGAEVIKNSSRAEAAASRAVAPRAIVAATRSPSIANASPRPATALTIMNTCVPSNSSSVTRIPSFGRTTHVTTTATISVSKITAAATRGRNRTAAQIKGSTQTTRCHSNVSDPNKAGDKKAQAVSELVIRHSSANSPRAPTLPDAAGASRCCQSRISGSSTHTPVPSPTHHCIADVMVPKGESGSIARIAAVPNIATPNGVTTPQPSRTFK